MDIFKALEGYLLDGRIANKSPATLDDYTREIKQFAQYTHATELNNVTPQDIKSYLTMQKEKGLAEYTIWGSHKRVKAFFRWCLREKLIEQNIFENIPTPKIPQLLPQVLDNTQLEKLFRQLKRDPSPVGKRNLTIFSVFVDCGIRSNELAHLKLEDVSFDEMYLMITHGKWGKQRPVPISPALKRMLWRYIAEYRAQLQPRDDYLFVNHEGRRFVTTGVQVMVRRGLAQIGVTGGTHLLRHTFATQYLRNGGDVARLRLILGHSTLEMTQQYLHLVPADLVKTHPQVSPLSNLRF